MKRCRHHVGQQLQSITIFLAAAGLRIVNG